MIGHSVSDEEVIVHTLNGLEDEYKELTIAIRARDSSMSFEELYGKLTDFEIYLKREDRLIGSSVITQVSRKSKRRGNQYKKTINKGLTKMPPKLVSSKQTIPPPQYQHFSHNYHSGYFNYPQP